MLGLAGPGLGRLCEQQCLSDLIQASFGHECTEADAELGLQASWSTGVRGPSKFSCMTSSHLLKLGLAPVIQFVACVGFRGGYVSSWFCDWVGV